MAASPLRAEVAASDQNRREGPQSDRRSRQWRCHSNPSGERLDRMQHAIHEAVLAYRRGGRAGKAGGIETVALDKRTVSVGDLVGLGIEQVQPVQLHAPAVFK